MISHKVLRSLLLCILCLQDNYYTHPALPKDRVAPWERCSHLFLGKWSGYESKTDGFLPLWCWTSTERSAKPFVSMDGLLITMRPLCLNYGMQLMTFRFKVKRWHKSRNLYYSNCDASFNLMALTVNRSGDVHPQPGPVQGLGSAIPVIITQRPTRSRANQLTSPYPGITIRTNLKQRRNLITIRTQRSPESLSQTDQNINGQSHNLKISHLNVQSLKERQKFHQVRDLVSEGGFDVLTVSETWFNSSVKKKEYSIDGYELVRLDRHAKTGGGVCAYIRKPLKFKKLKDLTRTSDCGFQQLWISIQHKNLRSFIICVAYRPPDIPTSCLRNELVPTYAHALTHGKLILIAGDLNCNMLVDCAESRALKDVCSMLNLTQLISAPTRITDKSETLIDVILTSNMDLVKRSDVLRITISDHFLVYCILDMKVPKLKPTKMTTRSYKNFADDKFCDDVSLLPWDTVSLFEHVDDQVSCFNDLFLDVLERHAPLKTFMSKHQKSKVITPEIRDLMRQRDNLLKRAHQSRNPHEWESYKALRREVKKQIRLSETQLIRNEINQNRNNKTSIWKTVRRCLNPCGNSALEYSRDSLEIANEFNEFFASVGENAGKQAKQLASKFDLPPISHPLSLNQIERNNNVCGTEFSFSLMSQEQVRETIMKMPTNKAPGHDKINMKVIKACLMPILPAITNIFNTSFSSACFPKDWKQAEVVVHPKEGDHEIAGNNRPISLLPTLSKALERLAHDQLVDYLTINNMLSVHQSGNKKLHSTETQGILFTSHLYKAIDEKKVTAVLMLDLSKAFDSIDHQKLLDKLRNLMHVSDTALSWFQSYLSDRTQRVRINSSLSSALTIRYGVPQGSILGPLLFNLYINDLPSVSSSCSIESYVDDSKLYISFSNKNIDSGLDTLRSDLNRVASWCCENRLLINPEKTKFCVFGTNQMLSRISIPPMMFLGKELPIVDSVKDLGVIIDNCLSFNGHVDALASDLVGKLAMISRIRHLFDRQTLFTIINSIVFTKLFYCSSVWSGTSKSNITKLQQVQNFAVRVLTGQRKYDRITPTLKVNKILPVEQVLKLRDAVLMYKCLNSLAPTYLMNMFKKRSAIHKHNTRSSNEIYLPKCRTALAQNSFTYRGASTWNLLPPEVRIAPSIGIFKHGLRKHLLNKFLST